MAVCWQYAEHLQVEAPGASTPATPACPDEPLQGPELFGALPHRCGRAAAATLAFYSPTAYQCCAWLCRSNGREDSSRDRERDRDRDRGRDRDRDRDTERDRERERAPRDDRHRSDRCCHRTLHFVTIHCTCTAEPALQGGPGTPRAQPHLAHHCGAGALHHRLLWARNACS